MRAGRRAETKVRFLSTGEERDPERSLQNRNAEKDVCQCLNRDLSLPGNKNPVLPSEIRGFSVVSAPFSMYFTFP